jgi:hypothetical protein
MRQRSLRIIIVVTGLFTALVHLFVLNYLMYTGAGHLDLLFSLNGIGYLTLLGLFTLEPAFLVEQWEFLHYTFMAFAAVTIIAFLILGNPADVLGWITKADELILIVALWLHQRGAIPNVA